MTAPRIISAYEAEGLLRHGTDAELAAAAPDLAASVVALHEEIKRLRRLTRRQFDDVLDECQEEVKSPSEDLAYADGTVTDRAFTRPVWDMMEEEP